MELTEGQQWKVGTIVDDTRWGLKRVPRTGEVQLQEKMSWTKQILES